MIDAVQDAGRVRHQGVAGRAAQVVGGQAFQDLVRHAVGRGQGQLQGRLVRDAGAVDIGRRLSRLLGKPADLMPGPVYQRDRDPQAAQQGDVQEQIAEVALFDDRTVHGDYKDLVAKARYVAKDLAQVRQT
jgi:hypothetical protein